MNGLFCECCGHPMPAFQDYIAQQAYITGAKREMFWKYCEVGRRGITDKAMWDHLYQLRNAAELPDLKIIQVYIVKLCTALEPHGLTIGKTSWSGGRRYLKATDAIGETNLVKLIDGAAEAQRLRQDAA